MTITVAVSGHSRDAVDRILPGLLSEAVASRITALDHTLWGPDAEDEAAKRLGWTQAVAITSEIVDEVLKLRDELVARGVDRVVLGGMGGSSLAPEVIARSYGAPLVVLDATDPGQVLAALREGLERTVVVISSKSGSTVETDSQKRAYEHAFTEAGIDPRERIVVVTDPGSPLDESARSAGYRVFNADPTVGGRYSALTAFGIVPSGLAGVDVRQLLAEAESVSLQLALDSSDNPGLVLGAAISGHDPLRDKLAIVDDGTHIVGFADWAEQLIAESTGKLGTGLLPVVVDAEAPELAADWPDLQLVRLVADAGDAVSAREGDILVSGTLGAQLLTWEYATAVAGRVLGINPFDQPDVESAKIAARGLLDDRPAPEPALFVDAGVEVRVSGGLSVPGDGIRDALRALLGAIPANGYLAVQAYLDRIANSELEGIRSVISAAAQRPVTFGWGPRFLHSTGQFHKGGPASGVFLQLLTPPVEDLAVPGRPFTFGELITAQAAGDAAVLAEHGRPVLSLTVPDAAAAGTIIRSALA